MNMRERVEATNQARTLLAVMASNPAVGQRALGKGRDLLNQVHNVSDAASVRDALAQMQTLTSCCLQQH